jgi:L-ribulose-5-phosphate 3-epimerase
VNTISFMTANYVARQVGYQMPEGWGQGDAASQKHFKPAKKFEERFEVYLKDIVAMGFDAFDLWTGILHPDWASEDHVDIANDLVNKYDLTVVSLAGWFGGDEDEFESACQFAGEVGAEILGGNTALLTKNRSFMVDTLHKYGLKFGLENHPEKTPEELIAKLGKGNEDVIGVAVDTGWFGTQGYDAAVALEKLGDRLFHVHLKDVLAVGGHDTCRFGQGVVPIEKCVETLKRIGYSGAIAVEHEPDNYDPTEDVVASLEMLKGWLA